MSQKINWVFIPYDKEKMFPTKKNLTPSPGHNDLVLFFTTIFMLLLVPEVLFLTGSFWKWVGIFFGDLCISVIITTFFVGILHEKNKNRPKKTIVAKERVEVLKEKDIVLAT